MGISGFAAIGGTALSGWQLYNARSDVRDALRQWNYYYETHRYTSEFNGHIYDLYQQAYRSAVSREKELWAQFAFSGVLTLTMLGSAVATCGPLMAAPTP